MTDAEGERRTLLRSEQRLFIDNESNGLHRPYGNGLSLASDREPASKNGRVEGRHRPCVILGIRRSY